MIANKSRHRFGQLFVAPLISLAWLSVILQTAVAARGSDLSSREKLSYHTDGRGTPKLIIPSAVAQSNARLGKQQVAEQFLRDHATELKLPADLSNLQQSHSKGSLLGTHYRYQQMLNGVPVEGAQVVVSVGRDSGQVYQAFNDTYPVGTAPAVPKTQLARADALDIAWNHLRVHGNLLGETHADLTYVPSAGGFRLIYKTLVPVEAPFGFWEHQIDAVSGEVVSVRDTTICGKGPHQPPDFAAYQGPIWDRKATTETYKTATVQKQPLDVSSKNTVNGTALVFDGDPRTYLANPLLTNTSPASFFTAAYVSRVLRDISETGGLYSLEGPWVQIVNLEAPATAPSTTTNGQWTFQRGTNAFDDAMVYFHLDQSQRYIQSLGYTNIQHGSIQADTDGLNGDDNSHYVPSGNYLAFGHGDVDDDEDADVILHEYGHAITQSIAPGWTGGDIGAIGEGFGDYWGASYSSTTTNGQTFHPEWAFSWDGHSPDTWTGRFLNLTNLAYDPSHTYAAHETISGIANYGDQLWSTPVFQAFLTLRNSGYPRTDMDKIMLESQYGIGSSATMRDLANAIINVATLLFPGGPHASVYTDKFVKQNILPPPPLPAPLLIAPVGGETFTTGAVVQVKWNPQGAPAAAAARLEYTLGSSTNFSDTMEGGVNGWTVSHNSGTVNWTQIVTATNHSPTHSWAVSEPPSVSDQYLVSPAITIGNGAQLSFWHSYNMETTFDGGVVEISTNSGSTWLDVGTNASQSGYSATISTSYSSPIGGRRAFSGSSGGFVQTLIPLSAFAGQNAKIRFRAASDSSTSGSGWFVDDVTIASQWTPIGTSTTNATNFAWTLPSTPSSNCVLRIRQFASGYTDSTWTQSAPFKISAAVSTPVTPFSITQASLANGAFQLNFTNTSGAAFTILRSTNLLVPLTNWTVVTGLTEITPGQFQFTDSATTNTPQAYYRVRSP